MNNEIGDFSSTIERYKRSGYNFYEVTLFNGDKLYAHYTRDVNIKDGTHVLISTVDDGKVEGRIKNMITQELQETVFVSVNNTARIIEVMSRDNKSRVFDKEED